MSEDLLTTLIALLALAGLGLGTLIAILWLVLKYEKRA
jgi:hypothetical protein